MGPDGCCPETEAIPSQGAQGLLSTSSAFEFAGLVVADHFDHEREMDLPIQVLVLRLPRTLLGLQKAGATVSPKEAIVGARNLTRVPLAGLGKLLELRSLSEQQSREADLRGSFFSVHVDPSLVCLKFEKEATQMHALSCCCTDGVAGNLLNRVSLSASLLPLPVPSEFQNMGQGWPEKYWSRRPRRGKRPVGQQFSVKTIEPLLAF